MKLADAISGVKPDAFEIRIQFIVVQRTPLCFGILSTGGVSLVVHTYFTRCCYTMSRSLCDVSDCVTCSQIVRVCDEQASLTLVRLAAKWTCKQPGGRVFVHGFTPLHTAIQAGNWPGCECILCTARETSEGRVYVKVYKDMYVEETEDACNSLTHCDTKKT